MIVVLSVHRQGQQGPTDGTDETATSLGQQAPMRSRNRPTTREAWWSRMKGRQFARRTRRSVTHQGQTRQRDHHPWSLLQAVPERRDHHGCHSLRTWSGAPRAGWLAPSASGSPQPGWWIPASGPPPRSRVGNSSDRQWGISVIRSIVPLGAPRRGDAPFIAPPAHRRRQSPHTTGSIRPLRVLCRTGCTPHSDARASALRIPGTRK